MIPEKWHFWTWAYAAEVVYFLHRCSFAITETTIQLFIYWHELDQVFYNNASALWHPSPLNHTFPDFQKVARYTEESNAPELDYLHNEVAKEAARYFMYYKLLLTIPAFLVGLFFGFWFERRTHAFQIAVPTFTWIALNVALFSAAIVRAEQPMPYILIGAAVSGLSGENVLQRAALFSYVGETTSTEERTTRFTRLTSALYFGLFTGSLLVGTILGLKETAFFLAFFTGALTSFGAIFVAVHYLRPIADSNSSVEQSTTGQKQTRIVGWHNLISSIKVYVRPRENNGRSQLLLMLGAFFLNRLCYMGEEYVTFLYVQGRPLRWHRSMLGFYMAVRKLGFGVGLLFFLRLLNLSDSRAFVISTFFDLGRILLVAFSNQTWMMFLAATCTTVTGLSLPVLKSIMSKLVDADEIRKYSGLISAVEVLGNIVGSIIFPTLYTYGINIGAMPGFIFLFEAVLSFSGLILGISAVIDIERHGGLEQRVQKAKARSNDEDESTQHLEINEEMTGSYAAVGSPPNEYAPVQPYYSTSPDGSDSMEIQRTTNAAQVPSTVLERHYGYDHKPTYGY